MPEEIKRTICENVDSWVVKGMNSDFAIIIE